MAYSQEEKEMWAEKDRRIVKLGAIKDVLGCPHWSLNDVDGEPDIETALELADKIVAWVYEEKTTPTPTQEQKEALEKVFKETGWNKEKVYSKFNKYPDNTNVNLCIERIKNV